MLTADLNPFSQVRHCFSNLLELACDERMLIHWPQQPDCLLANSVHGIKQQLHQQQGRPVFTTVHFWQASQTSARYLLFRGFYLNVSIIQARVKKEEKEKEMF